MGNKDKQDKVQYTAQERARIIMFLKKGYVDIKEKSITWANENIKLKKKRRHP